MTQVRCAIYTRKSTEEGLDQVFNTLDAQREACEAYIKSQAGEGWKALSQHYDDGGFSGGNIDRPALQRLLEDIDAGKVDVIVVYKVDRLTRSLMDFARIVERLDARDVSFVSVTQAFNTTSSMGRLTLNVLLSFAQFEREVTGERIRDKIAASKAKGMWMGGNIPLGYDLQDRKLLANPAEAELVRHIFRRFLALGSGVALMHELRREGYASKRWVARSGRTMGGVPFSCGVLYYILQNRLYLGEIVHRGVRHAGDHEAIVDQVLFEAAQEMLARNRRERRTRPTRAATCPLAGLVFDADGEPMVPTFSYGRKGRLYRYYVSASTLPGREQKPASAEAIQRVPAAALEKLVRERITQLCLASEPLSWEAATQVLRRVELYGRSIQLHCDATTLREPHEAADILAIRLGERVRGDRVIANNDETLCLICDRRPRFRGGTPERDDAAEGSTVDAGLISMLRSAHELLERHSMSPLNDSHSNASAPDWQRDRRLMALGLLSPSLQKQIAKGASLPIQLDRLLLHQLPLAWRDQVDRLVG